MNTEMVVYVIFLGIVLLFATVFMIFTLVYMNKYRKMSESKAKKSSTITYRNLYIGQASNSHVYGLNEYETQELAKSNQQCPPGYRWHSAIPSRRWV
ncbi:MAG: hypothetical protein ACRC6R_00170 [Bacteroidales bacterium]